MTKTSQPEAADPRRLRWSIPAADVSVNQWLDLQENISGSLRLLIRESIEREGYIDVVNKPVEQLLRRGHAQPGDTGGTMPTQPSQAAYAVPPGSSRAVQRGETHNQMSDAPPAMAHDQASSAAGRPSAPVESLDEPAAAAPPATPAQHEEPVAPAQASIDEIMSATRR
jgi:hypothetical protein